MPPSIVAICSHSCVLTLSKERFNLFARKSILLCRSRPALRINTHYKHLPFQSHSTDHVVIQSSPYQRPSPPPSRKQTDALTCSKALRTPSRSLPAARSKLSKIRALRPSRKPAEMSPRDNKSRSEPGKP